MYVNAESIVGIMPIFEAIINNDLNFVRQYLANDGDPSFANERGSSLLHEAVYEENLSIMEILLQKHADVNALDSYGNTPLHVACIMGNREAAQMLLKYGAEIDYTSEQRSWTPLMLALNEHYTEMAEWLIAQGADLNHVDRQQGWTPLLVACDQGLKDMTLQLIKSGSKVHARIKAGDAKGKSAIHLLSYYGEVELIKALVEQGVDVNLQPEGGGLSALHWAIYNGHVALMRFLVEQGADVNIKAGGIYVNRTPLHYAVAGRKEHMARYLLDYDADPLQKDEDGVRPIDIALKRFKEAGREQDQNMLRLLESYI